MYHICGNMFDVEKLRFTSTLVMDAYSKLDNISGKKCLIEELFKSTLVTPWYLLITLSSNLLYVK